MIYQRAVYTPTLIFKHLKHSYEEVGRLYRYQYIV